jgi:hypothetical protein
MDTPRLRTPVLIITPSLVQLEIPKCSTASLATTRSCNRYDEGLGCWPSLQEPPLYEFSLLTRAPLYAPLFRRMPRKRRPAMVL